MSSNIDNNNNNNQQQQDNNVRPKILYMPEIKDDYDRAKYSLVLDFPSCFQTINSAIECDKANKVKPGTPTKRCQEVHAHMNFCLLSTFCPDQAQALMECMKGRIPQEGVPVPKNCSLAWNLFDECLVNRTLLFEEEQKRARLNAQQQL